MGVGHPSELREDERAARGAIAGARWQETSVLSGLRANPIPRHRYDFGMIRGWRVLRRRPWAPYVIPSARRGRGSTYAHRAARVYTAVQGRRRFDVIVAECGASFVGARLARSVPDDRVECWRCVCTVEHRP